MKSIPKYVITFTLLFFSFQCTDRETYPNRCKELWVLSSIHSAEHMTDSFKIRCCEIIDGEDDDSDISRAEGFCLVDLVSKPVTEDTTE